MTSSPFDSDAYLEPLVDIARTIGASHLFFDGDSRSDWEDFFEWAKEFQANFERRLVAGEEPGKDYFIDIEDFALRKAQDAGKLKSVLVQ